MKYPYENKGNQILSENHEYSVPFPDKVRRNLRADCENCFGLCCVALYFSTSEGFPIDKDAGQPCLNLQPDFRCCVHKSLNERGFKGCIAYDCFGAGQKVSQVSFGGHDWRKVPESAKQMCQVFLIMQQLHELCVSVGLAELDCSKHANPKEFIRFADEKMYRCKNERKVY